MEYLVIATDTICREIAFDVLIHVLEICTNIGLGCPVSPCQFCGWETAGSRYHPVPDTNIKVLLPAAELKCTLADVRIAAFSTSGQNVRQVFSNQRGLNPSRTSPLNNGAGAGRCSRSRRLQMRVRFSTHHVLTGACVYQRCALGALNTHVIRDTFQFCTRCQMGESLVAL